MEKSKKGYFPSFPNRSSFSFLSPPLSTPSTQAISKYALVTSLQSMQMNGFSLKRMGYFSCFRTMFVRHDLGSFIPREREREGERGGGRERERERERESGEGWGGRIRYSGKDKVLYGEALA